MKISSHILVNRQNRRQTEMIKEAIVKIVSKQDLTYDEAYAVMN